MRTQKQKQKTSSSSLCITDRAHVFLHMIMDVCEYLHMAVGLRVGLGEHWLINP